MRRSHTQEETPKVQDFQIQDDSSWLAGTSYGAPILYVHDDPGSDQIHLRRSSGQGIALSRYELEQAWKGINR